jgi:hypothetical protein
MIRRRFPVFFSAVLFLSLFVSSQSAIAQSSSLSGAWVLNPALTQGPKEVGFNTPLVTDQAADSDRETRGGSRGRERAFMPKPESADDATRMSELTDEVREPPKRLTIADGPGEVVVTNERGEVRRFHPTAQAELIQLGDIPVNVTAQRNSDQLTVLYDIEPGRQLRYTYSRTTAPDRLTVDIEFVGKGGGDRVKHVYEPPSAAPQTPAGTGTAQRGSTRPGDEFKNLRTVGVVVDELSSQSISCGLSQSALETAISRRLTDAGFQVRKYQDQSPYVYVEILTTSLANGLCVSRYDVSLLTHAMTTLSYQESPVLVEISLLHEGGITGGSPAAHAENVIHGLVQYVDQFIARIREANQ